MVSFGKRGQRADDKVTSERPTEAMSSHGLLRSWSWKTKVACSIWVAVLGFVTYASLVPPPALTAEEIAAKEMRQQQKAEQEAAAAYKRDCGPRRVFAAHVLLKDMVRSGLKAPSTASFPSSPTGWETLGDCKFRIASYVDSQNGFGAMLRNEFVATMQYNRKTKSWRTLALNFRSR